MMTDVNKKMDDAICNDDFNTIESIALNPKYAYVKCSQFNMFTGDVSWVKRWVDISNVGEDYFDDLNGNKGIGQYIGLNRNKNDE